MSAGPGEQPIPGSQFALTLWTTEDVPDGSFSYVERLADAYTALHPNVTIDVVSKDVKDLGEDFEASSLAGDAPELLWTAPDAVDSLSSADLLLPLDGLVDRAAFAPVAAASTTTHGTLRGAPISIGNQLMLYWNKALTGDDAPSDSDTWIATAKEVTGGGTVGIAFNETDSFWLVPFLGGYGGSVFADDGVTPTLDTDAMRSALEFLYNLKYTDKVTPSEADYNVADGLFKEGKAGYIINGDWTLGAYAAAKDAETPGLGEDLGVGPLPTIVGADDPKPYITASLLAASKAVADDPDLVTVVGDFIHFATSKDNQVDIAKTLNRLPGNAEAIADPIVTADPLLAGAADAAQKGVPQPTNIERRCVFDAMNLGYRDMLAGSDDFAGLSAAMQSAAEACIDQL